MPSASHCIDPHISATDISESWHRIKDMKHQIVHIVLFMQTYPACRTLKMPPALSVGQASGQDEAIFSSQAVNIVCLKFRHRLVLEENDENIRTVRFRRLRGRLLLKLLLVGVTFARYY